MPTSSGLLCKILVMIQNWIQIQDNPNLDLDPDNSARITSHKCLVRCSIQGLHTDTDIISKFQKNWTETLGAMAGWLLWPKLPRYHRPIIYILYNNNHKIGYLAIKHLFLHQSRPNLVKTFFGTYPALIWCITPQVFCHDWLISNKSAFFPKILKLTIILLFTWYCESSILHHCLESA